MTRRQKIFSALGRFFKNLFTKNITLKVTALLFALLLWGYVLAMENPEYVKRVRDVDIAILGEDSLNNRGLMLVTRDIGTTDVDIRCKISKHSELDASRVTCSVDLSTIANQFAADEDTKTVSVEVTATLRDADYGTIEGLSTSSVDLTIARISSRSNVRVSVKTEGALPDLFTYSLEQSQNLTVSFRGKKSDVDKIARGEVTVDLASFAINDPSTLAGIYDLNLPVRFYDSANVLLDDIVTSNGESVTTNVRVIIRSYKDVPIVPDVSPSDLFNKLFEYECVPSQETVRLYGSYDIIKEINSIGTERILPEMEQAEKVLKTNLVVPEGTELEETQSSSISVVLSVTERQAAEPVTHTITINYVNVKNSLSLTGSEPKTVTLTVSGTILGLQTFNPDWIRAEVDLSGRNAGKHELPISFTHDDRAAPFTITYSIETAEVELTDAPQTESGQNH